MLELGSKQNMTGMETKRARGKCIANALVCQLSWTFLLVLWSALHSVEKWKRIQARVESGICWHLTPYKPHSRSNWQVNFCRVQNCAHRPHPLHFAALFGRTPPTCLRPVLRVSYGGDWRLLDHCADHRLWSHVGIRMNWPYASSYRLFAVFLHFW